MIKSTKNCSLVVALLAGLSFSSSSLYAEETVDVLLKVAKTPIAQIVGTVGVIYFGWKSFKEVAADIVPLACLAACVCIAFKNPEAIVRFPQAGLIFVKDLGGVMPLLQSLRNRMQSSSMAT